MGGRRPPRAPRSGAPPTPDSRPDAGSGSRPDSRPADTAPAGVLADSVRTAAGANLATPPAQLALTYARLIDEATHVPPAMADALELIEVIVNASESPKAPAAFRKIATALSAATITSDLGPKLLAALDALLLTPKAKAAMERKLDGAAGRPVNPLAKLRDDLADARARRAGA